MTSLDAVLVAGALVGAGAWAAWTGLRPSRPSLASVLGRLGQPAIAVDPVREDDVDARVGRFARRLNAVDHLVVSMHADLRILHRSLDEQAGLILAYTVLGTLWAPLVTAGGWAVGFRIPIAIPMWSALAGGCIGAIASVRSARRAAAERRRTFAYALSSFCDICGMCLAAGRGIESSLETAAHTGSGWAFGELQTALRTGYVRGDTPWSALARLGEEAQLADLIELAAALSLAGDEGAAVRETVNSKARVIRERLTAEAERDAASVTERMGVPATLLLLGFIVFLGYPAIAVLFE